MNKIKSIFPKDILNEIKWKEELDINKIKIYYLNRGSLDNIGYAYGKDIIKLDKYYVVIKGLPYEKYLPYHRITRIYYGKEEIFSRNR